MKYSDNITILWGGDISYANRLADILNRRGLNATVGGDLSYQPETHFLGHHVFRQIESSFSVILLITELPLRPNILIEWGYALSRLPRGATYPALIDIPFYKLPTDMRGVWTPEFYTTCGKDVLIDVADTYVKHIHSIRNPLAETAFDALVEWEKIHASLSEISVNNYSISSFHLRQLVANSAIPSVFNGDAKKVSQILERIPKHISKSIPEIEISKLMIKYYLDSDECAINNESYTMKRLQDIADRFYVYVDKSYDDDWVQIYVNNFLGLIYRKMAEEESKERPHEKKSDTRYFRFLEKSRDYLDCSIKILDRIDRSTPSVANSCLLWEGFVYFNLGRTHGAIGDPTGKEDFQDLIEKSILRRKEIYKILNGKVTNNIKNRLLLEYISAIYNAKNVSTEEISRATNAALYCIREYFHENSRSIHQIVKTVLKRATEPEQRERVNDLKDRLPL